MTYDPAGRPGHQCYIQVVAWEKFQHYKDRNPPWIKFYNSLLEDPGMAALPDASKAHLFGIWLLASRLDNRIPADPAFIGKRINATTKVDIKALILMGFVEPLAECLQHASNLLATCATTFSVRTQSRDRAETERETEIAPAAADAIPAVKSWNREAAELWWQEYKGKPTEAALFAPLKRIVKEYGWERVRPALVTYMAETGIAYVSIASKFGGAFGEWEEKSRGMSRVPPGKATTGDRTVAAMREFVMEESGDNEIGVLGGARQIGSGSSADAGRPDADGLPRSAGGRGGS